MDEAYSDNLESLGGLGGDILLQNALLVGKEALRVLMVDSITARAVYTHWSHVLGDRNIWECPTLDDVRGSQVNALLADAVHRLLTVRATTGKNVMSSWLWGLSIGAVAALAWVKWRLFCNITTDGTATSGHDRRPGNIIGMVGEDAYKKRDAVGKNQASVLMHLICKANSPRECEHTRAREVSAMSFLIDYKREMAHKELKCALDIASKRLGHPTDIAKWHITQIILSLCDDLDSYIEKRVNELYPNTLQIQLNVPTLLSGDEGATIMMLYNYSEWGSPHTDFGPLRHEFGCKCNMDFYGRATISGTFSSCIERGVDGCLGELSQAMILNEDMRERHLAGMIRALDISGNRNPIVGITLDEIYWSLCDCRHNGSDKIARAWSHLSYTQIYIENMDYLLIQEARAKWDKSFWDVETAYNTSAEVAERWGWGRYIDIWLMSAVHWVCVVPTNLDGYASVRGSFIYEILATAVSDHGSHHAFTAMVAAVLEAAGLWAHIYELGHKTAFWTKKNLPAPI
jgi:hypothetical protein